MKKYYQYFGLALIMVFSFYYTERISMIVIAKNPLMMKINEEAKNYNIEPVNAVISGDNVMPGVNGVLVNARESFYRMQESDIFNKYFLVYEQVKPDVSLDNNKDKIINRGNSLFKKVSIIIENEGEISNYLKDNNIKASLLVDIDTYKSKGYFEVINNEVEGFKALENNLNLNKENKRICVINSLNKDICKKNKNYLVSPELKLDANNFLEIKKNLRNGSIIKILDSAALSDVKLLLKEIKFKDLEIVFLSEIISEENNIRK